jgi:putative transposase
MLSHRITQRQHLLRPEEDINQLYLYALAVAAKRCEIRVHAWVAMSNHHHVIFTDVKGNFPKFLHYMHRLIAICVNALRKHRENVWAVSQPNVVWLVEKADCFDKLIYVLANPVSAGLVEHASEWPGAISLAPMLQYKKLVITRPELVFRETGGMPKEVELEIERLPGFERVTREDWKERVIEALKAAEKSAREKLREEKRQVLGRNKVLTINPSSRPATPDEKKKPGDIVPFIACLDKARRELEIEVLKAFREAYEIAREAWTKHKLTTRFPYGTYQRVQLGGFAATSPPRIA